MSIVGRRLDERHGWRARHRRYDGRWRHDRDWRHAQDWRLRPDDPHIAWKNPYAGWSRGIPTATDPDASSRSACGCRDRGTRPRWPALGINIYVGNNAGTDSLAAADLATLKAKGIYAIVGQDAVGLANVDDPTIVGWWMTPDEPDNAQ